MALALALKYRPTTFANLVGQDSIAKTLSLSLERNRIAHAYLFSGLRGSGKTSSARIFARALQCQKAPIKDPCNLCDSCLQSLEGRHLDIIEMDAASSRKIDDIRSLIEQTKYTPSFGKYKIFIIDEVHMLTKEAFNALLKTLEEPPSYVKFILATTDPLKLPATILSRTQHFRFKKIPHKLITEHLYSILDKEQIQYEKEAIDIIARSGNGSLRDTLTLTDQAISYCNQSITNHKVTEMLGMVDPNILKNFFYALNAKDHNKIKELLDIFEEYEAEMILDEMILYLKDSIHTNPHLPLLILDRYLHILAESKTLLNLNCDGNFVLLLASLKMQEAQKFNLIDEEIEQLEQSLHQNNTVQPTVSTTNHTQSIHSDLFVKLINKIYDRDFNLGNIFEKNITLINFDNNILTWKSSANNEDKELLRSHYTIIKHFVQEIFGIHTKISQQLCQEPQESKSMQYQALQKDLPQNTNQQLNSKIHDIHLPQNEVLQKDFTTSTTPTQSEIKIPDFTERNKELIHSLTNAIPIISIRKIKND